VTVLLAHLIHDASEKVPTDLPLASGQGGLVLGYDGLAVELHFFLTSAKLSHERGK
jgi:hypothetical protein